MRQADELHTCHEALALLTASGMCCAPGTRNAGRPCTAARKRAIARGLASSLAVSGRRSGRRAAFSGYRMRTRDLASSTPTCLQNLHCDDSLVNFVGVSVRVTLHSLQSQQRQQMRSLPLSLHMRTDPC